MRAGQLRDRVSILQRVEGTANTFGEPAITWPLRAEVPAGKETTGGQEVWIGRVKWSQIDYVITIRFREDLEQTDGIVLAAYDGQLVPELDILAVVDEEGRRRQLKLLCRKVS